MPDASIDDKTSGQPLVVSLANQAASLGRASFKPSPAFTVITSLAVM